MPAPGETITGPDGKVRVWQPDTRNSDTFDYLGPASGFSTAEEAHQADLESGQGSYVPGSFVEHWPWWLKAFVATGLGSAAVTGIGAAVAPGLFGATPVLAGTAPAATSTLLGATPSIGIGTAAGVPTAIGAPAAIGTGAALPISTGSITAGLPSVSLGATAPTSIGVGAAPTSSLIAGSGPSATIGTSQAVPPVASGVKWLQNLKNAGNIGQVLSGYAQGAGQGRQAEASLNIANDRNALERARLGLDQRTTGQNLESQARSQAAWGQFAQNPGNPFMTADIKAKYGAGPDFSGYSGIGADAYRDAQQRLLSGSDKQFTLPAATPMPNESLLERLARFGGLATGLVGGYQGYRPPTTGGR